MSWIEETIEEGIRDEVILLRANGFNTECSCHHEMYVQCQYLPEGEIYRLRQLLANAGYENYTISVVVKVIEGHQYPSMNITFDDKKKVERKKKIAEPEVERPSFLRKIMD